MSAHAEAAVRRNQGAVRFQADAVFWALFVFGDRGLLGLMTSMRTSYREVMASADRTSARVP